MHASVYDLVANFQTKMSDAAQRLGDLEKLFTARRKVLREDAAQILEFRGQILSYILAEIQSAEDRESSRLCRIRYAREKRLRTKDKKEIAEVQRKRRTTKRPTASKRRTAR